VIQYPTLLGVDLKLKLQMAIIFLVARIIFGGYFLMNAYNHLFKTSGLIGYAQYKGVKSPKFAVFISGILLLVGGLSIVLGVWPVYGAIALLVFLIPVTFKMHAFWKIADANAKMTEHVAFFKNIALIGAVLFMLSVPASVWVYSF
jgi:uncharacterized membrane protein YphA (DoxX/SURF4 family)